MCSAAKSWLKEQKENHSFIVNIKTMLMVQKLIDGAVGYEAPVMVSAEVSVENGFATSGYTLGGAGSYDDDAINDNGAY